MIFTWLYRWICSFRKAYDIDQLPGETIEEFLQRVLDGWSEEWENREL